MIVFKDFSIALRSSREDDDTMVNFNCIEGKEIRHYEADSSSAEAISIEESA